MAAGMLVGLAIWFWPSPRPHLLLVTLDTTRADRLGCYGYAAAKTPVLDALHRQRRGEAVVDAALAWLQQKRASPFFCWVHLYDPHAPYLAHDDLFGDEFADRPYDAEIAYVDRQVGRLVDFLKARGLEGQTLVVVVGDHGEGLGEHIEKAHGMTLYDATQRVPLIFRHLGRLPPGRWVANNLSLVDVSLTILDLLGLADQRKITGKSFRPLLTGSEGLGEGQERPSPCYGATDEPFLINGCSPLRSLTQDDWKYIRTTRAELYDLANDPHERQNLAEFAEAQAVFRALLAVKQDALAGHYGLGNVL